MVDWELLGHMATLLAVFIGTRQITEWLMEEIKKLHERQKRDKR